MDDTARIGLPLVQAAQAQKHVTVNAALARIDALLPLVIAGRDLAAPPADAAEGRVWAVPEAATGDWAGQAGRLALAVNGGWEFVTPTRGWTAFLEPEGQLAIHDGTGWRAGALTMSPAGAGLVAGLVEGEHEVGAGSSSTTAIEVPAGAMVIGATAEVLAAITGSATGWRLGTTGAPDRFGANIGTAAGSRASTILTATRTYSSASPLILGALGGSFAGGRVRVAVHFLAIAGPAG